MPYPTQINRDLVLQSARQRLESTGLEGMSLHQLAADLGVKAPSLYRYFANKNALLQAMNDVTIQELLAAMQGLTAEGQSTLENLRLMFRAYRQFAHANPLAYQLAFAQKELLPSPELAEQLALPLQHQMAKLTGESHALSALRGAWALVHGFVMLELSAQFRRSGDLEEAFELAITAYLRGWIQNP